MQSLRELDVLLALCKAAPSVASLDEATRLTEQLGAYLSESHTQLLAPSPFLRDIKPSPWEALTSDLAEALLILAENHPELHENVSKHIDAYIYNVRQAVGAIHPPRQQDEDDFGNGEEAAEIASITVSLAGFFKVASQYIYFWTIDGRHELVKSIQAILSEPFLVTLETASSTIRNSTGSEHIFRDWRKYSKRYAAAGRPLGAMLLQKGFMQLVVACSSTLVSEESSHRRPMLERFASGVNIPRVSGDDSYSSFVQTLTDVVTDEIRVLEDGSDYLQLSSAWQQRLACSVKADALTGFLDCMVFDEEIADSDVLMGWLEETLADQIQMSDEPLAAVVLKAMAVTAKATPNSAASLARLLMKFIVRDGARTTTVATAAQCLAEVLQLLSQDAVITTLYSLGNVLTGTSGGDKTGHQSTLSPESNGEIVNANASVLSFSLGSDDESTSAYRNVVHAIVIIAVHCNDVKIIALAQSILLQKIGRISLTVDACIIQESAVLSAKGHQSDLKLLLKLYARLSHDFLLQDKQLILDAVS